MESTWAKLGLALKVGKQILCAVSLPEWLECWEPCQCIVVWGLAGTLDDGSVVIRFEKGMDEVEVNKNKPETNRCPCWKSILVKS